MVSPLQSPVVIECPQCGTRYQLPAEAIGPQGRKVACAHCGETWQAKAVAAASPPDPDILFDETAEKALDDAFEVEAIASAPAEDLDDPNEEARLRTIADIKAAIAPKLRTTPAPIEEKPDPAGQTKRLKAFDKRQAAISRQSPLGRVRRGLRIAGVSALMLLIVAGVVFRTEVVKQFPDLAGVYETLGLGVNIVGLEFRDVRTLLTLRGGQQVIQVDGRIASVAAHTTRVPPVAVTLLDANDTPLYEWSVAALAPELQPGEVVDFSTQLTSPPAGASRIRLTFTDGSVQGEMPVATTPRTQ
jgi:predicted Zn finger-like uncharacterized protein